jgi:two-component system, OmpR family, response regulator
LPDPTALRMWWPPRVLVVDDCPDMRATLRTVLQLWGHQTAEAADGYAALGLAATFRPDAVLLDVGLPGLDGYEVARRLRQLPGLGNVLLVAITGHGRPEDVAACRAAGFDHHLLKPFDPAELEGLLRPRGGRCRPE